jgi:hypothetical protein
VDVHDFRQHARIGSLGLDLIDAAARSRKTSSTQFERLCCINSVNRSSSASSFLQAAIAKTSKSLFMNRTSSLTCGLHVRQWPRRIILITSNPLTVAAAVFIV